MDNEDTSNEAEDSVISKNEDETEHVELEVAVLPSVPVVNTYPGGAPVVSQNSLVNKNAISPLIQLTEALGIQEEIVFRSTGKIGLDVRTTKIQICGTAHNVILSTLSDPGVTIRHNSSNSQNVHTFRTGAITKFNNQDGITLLTCRETGRAQNISSGDRVFGFVDGVGLYTTELKARDPKGVLLFETKENKGKYSFISNEVEISQAGKGVTSNPEEFGFIIPDNVDITTKAMLLATAYYIYYLHVADAVFGLKGSKGVALAKCWFGVAAVVFILAILIVVIAIVITS